MRAKAVRWHEGTGQGASHASGAIGVAAIAESNQVKGGSRVLVQGCATSLGTAVVTPGRGIQSEGSVPEQEHVGDCQLPGVRECQEGAGGPERSKSPRGAAVKFKPRRAMATHDLDTRPEHAL